MISHTILE